MINKNTHILFLSFALILMTNSCFGGKNKIRTVFDSDTNNELDDQHALAYLLNSEDVFDVTGVTVNATYNGGGIDEQYEEAVRVVSLCGKMGKIPVLKGAEHAFHDIDLHLNEDSYDGKDAVEFLINQATRVKKGEKLVIIAVGKLTNIALALKKNPDISRNIRLVWLGSNYPEAGEYNLLNDIDALNFVLSTNIPFEMVLVRYGKHDGTDAVRVTGDEIRQKMSKTGYRQKTAVTGRDHGTYNNFGDYSISLFEHARYHGNDRSRALFDMAAVAVVKNPAWAHKVEIPAPVYENGGWKEKPENSRKISIWNNFNRDAIVSNFFETVTEKK